MRGRIALPSHFGRNRVPAKSLRKPAGSIATPNHSDGSREAAAHVEREKFFRVFDLPRARLFRQLLICFENLANSSRSDRVTVGDQAAACVYWNLERPFEFFRAHLR